MQCTKSKMIFVLFLLCSLMTSCISDEIAPEPPSFNGDEAMVLLTISAPQTSIPRISRLPRIIDPENQISSVQVLVMEYDGNEFVYKYTAIADGLYPAEEDEQKTRFKVLLKSTSNPVELLLIANADRAFESYTPTEGLTETELKEEIAYIITSNGITGELPMYGKASLASGLNAGSTTNISSTLLRAIARVDVEKNLLPTSHSFILEEVYVFRANDKIQIIPDVLENLSEPKVTSPSVPQEASFLQTPIVKSAPEGSEAITRIYVPESNAVNSENEKLSGTTCIIVGGKYNGESKTTYYRANFDSNLDGHPFGQILRNYRYVFKIKNVTGSGLPTPEEAANKHAVNMTAEVKAWEDFTTEMWFEGENYIGVSSRSIRMAQPANDVGNIQIQSTVNYTIQWLDENDIPTGDITSSKTSANAISNEHFEVKIVKSNNDQQDISHLQFRTLNENSLLNNELITGRLQVTAGKWNFTIDVTQENNLKNIDREIYVLSLGTDVGNLGNMNVAGSGAGMRNILRDARNFSPTGKVKIKGFVLQTRGSGVTNALTSQTSNEYYDLVASLEKYDVLFLPYATNPTSVSSQIIDNWLNARPNRVLILSMDYMNTNYYLLKNIYNQGGTHQYAIPNHNTNFIRADITSQADQEEFFNGPFGIVPEQTIFRKIDTTWGRLNPYNPDLVTPLMVDIADKGVLVGVNKSQRIIYLGESQLYETGYVNNSGTITDNTTPINIFHANIWAWIAKVVCNGDL